MLRTVLAILLATTLLLGCSSGAPSGGQVQRNFPQNALRGSLVIGEAPEVLLNGRSGRLAPGARIRDTGNMAVVPAGLIGGRFLVHYTIDTSGLVKDVWILTPAEAAKRWPSRPEEAAAWSFDPAAQVWIRP